MYYLHVSALPENVTDMSLTATVNSPNIASVSVADKDPASTYYTSGSPPSNIRYFKIQAKAIGTTGLHIETSNGKGLNIDIVVSKIKIDMYDYIAVTRNFKILSNMYANSSSSNVDICPFVSNSDDYSLWQKKLIIFENSVTVHENQYYYHNNPEPLLKFYIQDCQDDFDVFNTNEINNYFILAYQNTCAEKYLVYSEESNTHISGVSISSRSNIINNQRTYQKRFTITT